MAGKKKSRLAKQRVSRKRKRSEQTGGSDQQIGDVLQHGLNLHRQKNLSAAEEVYRSILARDPNNSNALHLLGLTYAQREHHYEAIEFYNRAIAIDPGYAGFYNNRGISFNTIGEHAHAIADFRKSLDLTSDNPAVYNNLGNALCKMDKRQEAIEVYENAIRINPRYVSAYYNLGNNLNKLHRYDEAAEHFRRVLSIQPEHQKAYCNLAFSLRNLCDWREYSQFEAGILNIAKSDATILKPFSLLLWSDDPALQLQYVRRYAQHTFPASLRRFNPRLSLKKEKIRIGYISTDFRDHAVSLLTAELYELHDREKFEVYGFALGARDSSPMRKRLEKAFDHFIEVGHLSDVQVADLIHEQGIQILVDLNGYTVGARTQILAMRPAPIQINYLGYIGTMGADFIDYILVDKYCVPEILQPCFVEKLVHLPGYMVNDRQRTKAANPPSRSEVGLPENSFVFSCFNNNYKITPQIFSIWMRCLENVPGSVLWLLAGKESIEQNLRKEAQLRGIAPDRLVFAQRTDYANHIARQQLADLFLDTLPYNAGASASDALWSGLPVLTCQGRGFAGRMCSSLLHAVDLPELVVGSLDAYEALAIRLAGEPKLLSSFRKRLIDNRESARLFDSPRFCQYLEQEYITMCENLRDQSKDSEPF